jgi:non-specific serine/threonine protein kinase
MPKMASVARTVKEQFGHSYSTEFVTAIQHALAIQPGDRPQSVDGFVAEMQLKHPGDMSRFDWRAEIGDEPNSSIDLQLQMPEPGQPEIAGMLESTIVQTQTQEPTQPEIGTVVETTVIHTVTEPADVSTHPGKTRNIGVLMLVAAVLLAGWWVLKEQFFGTKTDRTSNTALITKDPAPALTPPSVDLPVVVQPGTSTVSSPAPFSKPASSPIHRRHTLDIPSSTPVKTEPPITKPVYIATMQTGTVRDQAAQVAQVVLCADSNFFTRSMCVYQECQETKFADLPVCVENRRKYPANKMGVDRR